jgi:hypothetical protein
MKTYTNLFPVLVRVYLLFFKTSPAVSKLFCSLIRRCLNIALLIIFLKAHSYSPVTARAYGFVACFEIAYFIAGTKILKRTKIQKPPKSPP